MNKDKKEARGEKRERWSDSDIGVILAIIIGIAFGKLLGVITEVLWGF